MHRIGSVRRRGQQFSSPKFRASSDSHAHSYTDSDAHTDWRAFACTRNRHWPILLAVFQRQYF